MSTEIGNKIKALRGKLKLSQEDFSAKISLSRSLLSQIEIGKSNPTTDTLATIANVFRIDMNYFFYQENESLVEKSLIAAEPDINYGNKSLPTIVTVDSGGKDNMVMVDQKAAAGYVANIANPAFVKQLPTMRIDDKRFQNGTYRAWAIQGDSMLRTLAPGQWVATRLLSSLDEIREGYIHIVVTREMVTAKRLLNRIKARGKIVCQSDNKSYSVFEIDASEVLEVWVVICKLLDFDLSNPDLDILSMYNSMQAEMAALKSRVDSIERK